MFYYGYYIQIQQCFLFMFLTPHVDLIMDGNFTKKDARNCKQKLFLFIPLTLFFLQSQVKVVIKAYKVLFLILLFILYFGGMFRCQPNSSLAFNIGYAHLLHDAQDIKWKYSFLECKYTTKLYGSITDCTAVVSVRFKIRLVKISSSKLSQKRLVKISSSKLDKVPKVPV